MSESNEDVSNEKTNNKKRLRIDSLPNDFDNDLQCPVCKEIPIGMAYSCESGCLICHSCLRTILSESKSLCPKCRIDLKKNRPSRNLLAECLVKVLTIPC